MSCCSVLQLPLLQLIWHGTKKGKEERKEVAVAISDHSGSEERGQFWQESGEEVSR